MRRYDIGEKFRDGLLPTESSFLRWGVVEDVVTDDVKVPITDQFGNNEGNDTLVYSRSLLVRWLHHSAGRVTVRHIEPAGVTSVPMKGSIVLVGFVGGPGGEPVILGTWTDAYKERIPAELGNMRPGQEVWRRSGLRFRVVPYYDDLREFSNQYMQSPWSVDILVGEQHDEACFCPKCQTRYPAEAKRDERTGKLSYVCPLECEICKSNDTSSTLVLVKGSVGAGEGDAWLELQADILVSSALKGLYDSVDERVIGQYINDIQVQQLVRNWYRNYLYLDVGPTWGKEVTKFYREQLVNLWQNLLTTYFKEGALTNVVSDVPGLTGTITVLLAKWVDGWINTTLLSYLLPNERLTDEERGMLIKGMSDNVKSYVTDYLPQLCVQHFKNFVYNKTRIYVSETLAKLRRKAVNWIYKDFLQKYGDATTKAIGDWLSGKFGGVGKAVQAAAEHTNEFLKDIANNDYVKWMSNAIEQGLKDPEELPIFEIRADQDLTSVVDTKLAREEGRGQKAPRFRMRIYRDGEMRIQVQENVFLYCRADGSVELDCNQLTLTSDSLLATLSDQSDIQIKDVLQIGVPTDAYKEVTLDKDNVREQETVSGYSTRKFVEDVAWRHIAGQLVNVVNTGSASFNPAEPIGAGNSFKLALEAASLDTTPPPSNTVIGKTEASAKHLKGN